MFWQAVLFDLDDTLYLEQDYVISGFRAVAGWLGGRFCLDREELFGHLAAWFRQGVRGNTFDMLLDSLSLERCLLDEMIRVYREHEPDISPCPEVPRVLASLTDRCSLGLVTDGFAGTQHRKLSALGLQEYFGALIISDELPGKLRKPNPLPFQAALEKLDATADKAVYVADNPGKDFLGARRAGLASVRVRRPQGLYSKLEPADGMHAPDLETGDLVELERLLNGLAAPR